MDARLTSALFLLAATTVAFGALYCEVRRWNKLVIVFTIFAFGLALVPGCEGVL